MVAIDTEGGPGRALRVMRVSLLAGQLGQMHLTSSGALLTGAASVRLFQLIASVATLLFTASSVIVLLERRPFHDALYFVVTTLTTVRAAFHRCIGRHMNTATSLHDCQPAPRSWWIRTKPHTCELLHSTKTLYAVL